MIENIYFYEEGKIVVATILKIITDVEKEKLVKELKETFSVDKAMIIRGALHVS